MTRGDHSAVPHCSHYILPSGQATELQRAEVCAPLCHIFLVIQSRLTKFSSLGGTSVSCTFTGCSGDKLIDTCLVKNPWKTLSKLDTAKQLGEYIFSIGQVALPQPHYYLHHPVLQTVILSVTINPPQCLSFSAAPSPLCRHWSKMPLHQPSLHGGASSHPECQLMGFSSALGCTVLCLGAIVFANPPKNET